MSEIKSTYGEGAISDKSHGGETEPPLATVLQEIADDLETLDLGEVAAIEAADLAAFTNPPTVGEMAALRTLVNEIKTKINAAATARAARGDIKTVRG